MLLFVTFSCESFLSYEEYIVNKSGEDIVLYFLSTDQYYSQSNLDSVILKNNDGIKVLTYSEMNGLEILFKECDYPIQYLVGNDSVFAMKKVGDSTLNYILNDRSRWSYERVEKKFQNVDCECKYNISQDDF